MKIQKGSDKTCIRGGGVLREGLINHGVILGTPQQQNKCATNVVHLT